MTGDKLAIGAVAALAALATLKRGRTGDINRTARPQPGVITAYHGTNRVFPQFGKHSFGSSTDAGTEGEGFYFHTDREAAVSHAQWVVWKHGGDPIVMEVEVSVNNPKYLTRKNAPRHLESDSRAARSYSRSLQKKGHDGVIKEVMGGESYVIVAYEPDQIRIVDTQSVEPW
jgi:hypothetical protein